jgi:hypothetical protein
MVRARATKAYRTTAHWAAKATDLPVLADDGDIPLQVRFYPPSRRGDKANMPAMLKAGIDGIADAWGVNDRRFVPTYTYADPVKGGRVEVSL